MTVPLIYFILLLGFIYAIFGRRVMLFFLAATMVAAVTLVVLVEWYQPAPEPSLIPTATPAKS
jgi:hypothetical protein